MLYFQLEKYQKAMQMLDPAGARYEEEIPERASNSTVENGENYHK